MRAPFHNVNVLFGKTLLQQRSILKELHHSVSVSDRSRDLSASPDTGIFRRFGREPGAPHLEKLNQTLNDSRARHVSSVFRTRGGLPMLGLPATAKIEFPEDNPREKGFWIFYGAVCALLLVGLLIYLATLPVPL